MKRLAIQAAAVLTVCLCVCFAGQAALFPLLDEAQALCGEASAAAARGDSVRTRAALERLDALWSDGCPRLETFCDHEDLRTVREHILQARLSSDGGELAAALAMAGEALKHIRDEEALRWRNLL